MKHIMYTYCTHMDYVVYIHIYDIYIFIYLSHQFCSFREPWFLRIFSWEQPVQMFLVVSQGQRF